MSSGGVEDVAIFPLNRFTFTKTPPSVPFKIGLLESFSGGVGKFSAGVPARVSFINWLKITPASLFPPAFIGDGLVFPTQTPVTKEGVYPMVQASLLSLVVPVLAATGRSAKNRVLFKPKI